MTSPRATFVAVRGAGHAGYTIPVRFVEVKHLSVRMSAAFAIEITLSMCCVKDIATCFSTPLARCRGAWLGVGGPDERPTSRRYGRSEQPPTGRTAIRDSAKRGRARSLTCFRSRVMVVRVAARSFRWVANIGYRCHVVMR